MRISVAIFKAGDGQIANLLTKATTKVIFGIFLKLRAHSFWVDAWRSSILFVQIGLGGSSSLFLLEG